MFFVLYNHILKQTHSVSLSYHNNTYNFKNYYFLLTSFHPNIFGAQLDSKMKIAKVT